MQKINIPSFDLKTMKQDPKIALIGKRGSGKSTLIKDLIYNMNYKLENIYAISVGEEYDKFYGNFLNKQNIHCKYDDSIISDLMEQQEERLTNSKETAESILLILDDCLHKKIMQNTSFKDLIYNGRNYKIGIIMTMQYPLMMTVDIKCNIDYIFATTSSHDSDIKKIYDYWNRTIPLFDTFKTIYDNVTQNYNNMVINYTAYNDMPRIFRYKALVINDEDIKHKLSDYHVEFKLENNEQEDEKSQISNYTESRADSMSFQDKEALMKIINILEIVVNKILN